MANQIAQDKVRTHYVLPKKLVARMDGRAAADGVTRTDIVVAALEAYLGDKPIDIASKADFDILAQKIETLISKQDTLISKQETSVALLGAKIEAQPIVVQGQLEAPAEETPDEPTYTQQDLEQAAAEAADKVMAEIRGKSLGEKLRMIF